jgi:hypothetical protein
MGYKEDKWGNQISSVRKDLQKEAVGKEQPFRVDLRAEAEEFLLLEAVTRERFVKTKQNGKKLSLWYGDL